MVYTVAMTYSLDLRYRVISFIKEGGSKSEAIRTFKLSRDTIYRWLNAKDLTPKKHGPRNRKIDKKALLAHVDEYPDMFLRERALIFEVDPSAISYALKKLGYRKKKNVDI